MLPQDQLPELLSQWDMEQMEEIQPRALVPQFICRARSLTIEERREISSLAATLLRQEGQHTTASTRFVQLLVKGGSTPIEAGLVLHALRPLLKIEKECQASGQDSESLSETTRLDLNDPDVLSLGWCSGVTKMIQKNDGPKEDR